MHTDKNTKYRPIELVHDFKFIPCSFPQDMPLPNPRERLEHLKRLGYGGVAVSPSYDDYLSEESIKETCDLIKYAKELGLLVWIYDEKFYPSGSAAGTVPRENPKYEAKALAMLTKEPDEKGVIYLNSPHGYGSVIAAYVCELDENGSPLFGTCRDVISNKTFGGGIVLDCHGKTNLRLYAFFGKSAFEFCTTSHNTRGVRRYIDTLDRNASDAFFKKTYEGYSCLENLGDYVEAVFTDEPQIPALCRQNYRKDYLDFVTQKQSDVFRIYDIPDPETAFSPYIPWTEQLPSAFAGQHGYELAPNLPRLFADESEQGKTVRADFWDTVSELFRDNFSKNYARFCKQSGVKYSGHFLGEEQYGRHPYMHGDLLAQLGEMDIPGCDMLYASPQKILQSASAIKFAGSAAQLYGKADVMIEASNITRDIFPITKESYMLATALETALGVTRFLSYYTDFCMNDDDISECCDFTENLLSALDGMIPVRNVFLYIPNRSYYSETYPSYSVSEIKPYTENQTAIDDFMTESAEKLSRANIDFCYINDESLSNLNGDSILIVPPHAKIPKTASNCRIISENSIYETIKVLSQLGCQSITTETNSDLISLHKCSDTAEAFLIVNTGEDFSGKINLNTKYPTQNTRIYNPHNNTFKSIEYTESKIEIPTGECRIIYNERT